MRTILVEPHVLESSANVIDDYNLQVQENVKRLYQMIEGMSTGWKGSDNVAFVQQIQGYQDDFAKISMLLTQYIEFLRISARAYRQTQAELAAQASRLTN